MSLSGNNGLVFIVTITIYMVLKYKISSKLSYAADVDCFLP